jgi:predicted regulator of Ras-like GTPase activity (Roadblock/LC7/MglB family)
MPGYAVTSRQSELINTAISDLLVMAEADAVFVIDSGGNIIASNTPKSDDISIQTMAALAAGSFSATRELAGMIGEPGFHSIYHQGENAGICIFNVASNFLILVLFGKTTTQGLVRLYVDKAGKEVEMILRQIDGQSIDAASQGEKFELDDNAGVFKAKDESNPVK